MTSDGSVILNFEYTSTSGRVFERSEYTSTSGRVFERSEYGEALIEYLDVRCIVCLFFTDKWCNTYITKRLLINTTLAGMVAKRLCPNNCNRDACKKDHLPIIDHMWLCRRFIRAYPHGRELPLYTHQKIRQRWIDRDRSMMPIIIDGMRSGEDAPRLIMLMSYGVLCDDDHRYKRTYGKMNRLMKETIHVNRSDILLAILFLSYNMTRGRKKLLCSGLREALRVNNRPMCDAIKIALKLYNK